MKHLFAPANFAGFGPCSLGPELHPPSFQIEARRASGLRSRVRHDCPKRPGVYGMIDERNELIYVGKARCLRTRLLSYFRPRSRDPKAGRIIRQARRIVWELAPTELSALLRELELIRRWRPRWNVQGQPRRRRPRWVCLGPQPAPYLSLLPRIPRTVQAAFGPVPGGPRAREAVRRLNDWFRLRDCPQPQEMVFAEQRDLFPLVRAPGCLRHEIGQCLAPCAAGCTQQEYQDQVRKVRAFLEGVDLTILTEMEKARDQAAAAQQFELASTLRDRLRELRWLHAHLERLREARVRSVEYTLQGFDGQRWSYLIHRGQVRAIVPAPAKQRLRDAVFGEPSGPLGEEVENVLLVAAWFRKRPNERQRCAGIDAACGLA